MKKAITLLTVVFASATAIASASPMMDHDDHMSDRHEMKEQYKEFKAEMESTIIENDYEAYKALMAQKRDQYWQWDDGMKKNRAHKDAEHTWFTDAEHEERMKEHFDKQVAYYEENGELMQKKWMPSHKRSGKYFWDHEKWIVKAALNNVSDEKLTKVIERIDTLTEKLDHIDDEKIVDMLLGIREVLATKLVG